MNNFFDARRFGLLLKKQWIENWKKYVLGYGILVVLLIGLLVLNLPKKYASIDETNKQIIEMIKASLFSLGLLLTGVVLTNSMFLSLQNRIVGTVSKIYQIFFWQNHFQLNVAQFIFQRNHFAKFHSHLKFQ